MVWEQKVQTIVMLTKDVEGDKVMILQVLFLIKSFTEMLLIVSLVSLRDYSVTKVASVLKDP